MRPMLAAEDRYEPPHFDAKNSSIDTNQLLLQMRLAQLRCFCCAVGLQSSACLLSFAEF